MLVVLILTLGLMYMCVLEWLKTGNELFRICAGKLPRGAGQNGNDMLYVRVSTCASFVFDSW